VTSVRTMRYELREVGRRLSSIERVAGCGIPMSTEIKVMSDGKGKSWYSGVATCASVWFCPTCSARIRARRAETLQAGLDRFCSGGGWTAMLTLTVGHHEFDELQDLVDAVVGTWSTVNSSSAYVRAKARAGMVGFVRSLEVTAGQNGWHPHMHVLLLFRRELSSYELARFVVVIRRLWRNRLRTKYGREVERRRKGVHVRRMGQGANHLYVGKLQEPEYWRTVASELASLDTKSSTGRLPFELLQDAGFGDQKAFAQWHEFQEVMAGRHCYDTSRGLLQLLGMVEETDDEILNNEDQAPEIYVVLSLSVAEYTTLRRARALGDFLDWAEKADPDAQAPPAWRPDGDVIRGRRGPSGEWIEGRLRDFAADDFLDPADFTPVVVG